ncbi:hypothetical protein M0R45_013498 [Rubus argutus]|uniref:Uncharacterized protein n=1 Tax=Rubus argutus TaxID=59490 RepID=A0AAW1XJL9_RUBAR
MVRLYSNNTMDMVILFIVVFCMALVTFEAQAMTLPADEVQALHDIAEQLNKKDGNLSEPCRNIPTFSIPHTDQYNNTLVCNCSFSGNVCHVQTIFLVGQDLNGVLPPSLVKLPYIKELNLAQNYLSGSIPREWGFTKLEFLVLSVNNLSGPIPAYLGNITTLRALALERNLFSGTIPPEMGKLINMEVLYLRANNLTGELPVALTNLTKLKTLWIGSNNFTGKIPNYFLSWKELQMLEMQASGLEGPIPSGLSASSNMRYLAISDLSDVYSFGVVALELVSGKNNIKYRPTENYVCLLDWALVLQQKGSLMELVDPKLGSEFNKEGAMRMIKVALLCTNPSPALRPTMSAALSMLEGRAIIHELIIDPSMYGNELGFKALRDEYHDLSIQQSPGETQSLINSSNAKGPDASSSRTVQDSYTFNLDSP